MKNILKAMLVLIPTLIFFTTASASGDDYKVGVYYFGVWSVPGCNACYGNNTVNPNPWIGVNDTQYATNREPAIGFYDNSTADTLETHIRQARANGLDYFNFYWYWDTSSNERHHQALLAFLEAENSEDMEFAVSITEHGGELSITSQDVNASINKIVEYASKPNYLKTTDGRPVIFILDTTGLVDGTEIGVIDYISTLRQKVEQTLQVTPFIVISGPDSKKYDGSSGNPNYDINEAVDGYSCLSLFGMALVNPDINDLVGDYHYYAVNNGGQFALHIKDFVNSPTHNKAYIPCFMSHFHEGGRAEALKKIKGLNELPEFRTLENWSMANLKTGFNNLKALFNDPAITGQVNYNLVPKYINLFAWNEWREAEHVFEPTKANGTQVLDKFNEVFNKAYNFTGVSATVINNCKKFGDCEISDHVPEGTLDVANCSTIEGWARDADTSTPIKVHIYKDGPHGGGGTFVAEVLASNLRSDLPFKDQHHGFSFNTPSSLKDGNPHTIYAYGLDIDWNGDLAQANQQLNLTQTLQCN